MWLQTKGKLITQKKAGLLLIRLFKMGKITTTLFEILQPNCR